MRIELSIVSALYQTENICIEFLQRVLAEASKITPHFEIVLVEDGGRDGSWKLVQEFAAREPRVRAIRFNRNFGQHYALTAGVDMARGEWIVVMDCDLQEPPEEIHRFYAKAREGYDVVQGLRKKRSDSLLKRTAAKLFYYVFSYCTEIRTDPSLGTFRIMSRKAASGFMGQRERVRHFNSLVAWVGLPSTTLEFSHHPRPRGKSSFTWAKRFNLALDAIVSFSDKPLRLILLFGVGLFTFSSLAGFYTVLRGMFGRPMEGWLILLVALGAMISLVFLAIGVVGVYAGKILIEVKHRPLYLVRDSLNIETLSLVASEAS